MALKEFGKEVILFALLFAMLAFAIVECASGTTPPTEEWNRTFGGPAEDCGYLVQQTTDGGCILAGYTRSYGAGMVDAWLVKTDSRGNEEWNKTFGGPSFDAANSVQQTSDGGYILAGYTSSPYAANDFWLVKTDSSGNEEWNKTFGGSFGEVANSVQQTSDGGYILAGYTLSYGAGGMDFWLVKTDSTGNKEWDNTFGGYDWEEANSVQQTSDGGYILAGWTNSYGGGSHDFWLVKTDSSGSEEWNKTFEDTGYERANSVQQTSDGGYILAGYTGLWGGGDCDFWLVKTDSNGNKQWDSTFGGPSFDVANSVQQTADSGYILAGGTTSYGAGSCDVLLVKTDSNGNMEWNKTFGGPETDWAHSVQQTSDGGYILAGYTRSYGAGGSDFWLIKVKGEPEENQPPNANFTYSPQNPIINQIITFDASNSHDPDGTIVKYEWEFGDGNIATGTIVTNSYPSVGAYAVTLTTTDNDGATDSISKEICIDIEGLLNVPFFSQRDLKWCNKKLDHSPCSIGMYGCALTSLAMVSKYYGYDTDPDRLNTSLTEVGELNEYGSLDWRKIEDITDEVRYEGWWTGSWEKIDQELSESHPVIANVSYPTTGYPYHFIVFIGKIEDKYYFLDPYDLPQCKEQKEIREWPNGKLGTYTLLNLRIYHGSLPPIADAGQNQSVFSGSLVILDGSNSYDPDPGGTIVSYEWDFGDGETAEGRIVTHRFRGAADPPRTYAVNLTVEDDTGDTDMDTAYISVMPLEKTVEVTHRPPLPIQPVYARMTASYNWIHDNTYVVSKIHSESEGFLGIGTISVWDLHSHVIPTPLWATNIFSHGSKKEKTYYPKLVTILYGGDTFEGIEVDAFDAMNIYIEGWAGISIPMGLPFPVPFFKTNSTCFEPDYTEVPDLPIEASDLELAYLCSPGELRVYDSQGRVTGLVNGEVKNEIPNSSYDNNTVILLSSSDMYRYIVAGTEDGSYGLIVASITEGGNTTFTAANISTTVGATHQYTFDWEALSQGEKGVTVQIDSDGDGVFEQTIITDDTFQLPIASFTYSPENPVVNETITFDASNSYDPDGIITKYGWNFGNGNITDTTESIITHSYASAGDYTVNLTVTDDEGATSSTSQLIKVTPKVPPNITSFAPPSPINDSVCNWRRFSVTVNQTVNVSWYLNNSFLFKNASVMEANYTLHAQYVGENNVSAVARNANGTDMQTWVWNVAPAPLPVLEINKTDNPDPVSPGGILNYSIHVNNTGNATATNVIVTETYDANVTFLDAVPAPSQGSDTWQFATLNVGESKWINISVTINASVLNETMLHNIVNVTCDEGVTDSDTEDTTVISLPVCIETATGTGIACFETDTGTIEDLVAVNEATLPEEGKPTLVFPHGFFSFDITGLTPGQAVVVTITLPDNVPVGTQYWKYRASEGGWIQIPMGSDDGDEIITITLVDGGLGDDDGTANGVIVDQGGPGMSLGISVTKVANPPDVAPSSNVEFTITVPNTGDCTLDPVRVVDTLPAWMSYVSSTPAADTHDGTIIWNNVGPLDSGDSKTITLVARIASDASGTLTNAVTVTGTSPTGEEVTGSDTVTVTVLARTIEPPTKTLIDVTTEIKSDRTVIEGEQFGWMTGNGNLLNNPPISPREAVGSIKYDDKMIGSNGTTEFTKNFGVNTNVTPNLAVTKDIGYKSGDLGSLSHAEQAGMRYSGASPPLSSTTKCEDVNAYSEMVVTDVSATTETEVGITETDERDLHYGINAEGKGSVSAGVDASASSMSYKDKSTAYGGNFSLHKKVDYTSKPSTSITTDLKGDSTVVEEGQFRGERGSRSLLHNDKMIGSNGTTEFEKCVDASTSNLAVAKSIGYKSGDLGSLSYSEQVGMRYSSTTKCEGVNAYGKMVVTNATTETEVGITERSLYYGIDAECTGSVAAGVDAFVDDGHTDMTYEDKSNAYGNFTFEKRVGYKSNPP